MALRGLQLLVQVHPDLCRLVEDVGAQRDIQVVQGARSIADEQKAIDTGHSALKDPTSSKHVIVPGIRDVAEAVDITPYPVNWMDLPALYPVNWMDLPAFKDMGAFVKERAADLGIPILWGGDFRSLHDYDHFELVIPQAAEAP